jgi:hypothetical protein
MGKHFSDEPAITQHEKRWSSSCENPLFEQERERRREIYSSTTLVLSTCGNFGEKKNQLLKG